MDAFTAYAAVLDLAARQHHLVWTSDMAKLGIHQSQIDRFHQQRLLERLVRGLSRIPGTRTPMQDVVAAVSRHAGAAASHVTGCWLHGLDTTPPPRPHLTVPPGATSHTTLGVLHRSPLPRCDRTVRKKVPVTTLPRALVDAAALVPTRRFDDLVAQAVCERRTTIQLIERTARRVEQVPGRQGSGRLRRVLASWTDELLPDSVAEAAALRRIHDAGLPMPVTQHEIRDDRGRFVARVDLAWPDQRVLREYDSDRYHPPPKVEKDERRRQELEALGWKVDALHRGHLSPSRTDWLDDLASDLGVPLGPS